MAWTVQIHDAAVREILDFPRDLRARFEYFVGLIQEDGWERLPPKASKFLGDGLWELRMMGKDSIARAFYVQRFDKRVVVVHAFVKKTQKTPPREIKLARFRAKGI